MNISQENTYLDSEVGNCKILKQIRIVDKFIYDLSIYLVSLKNIFDPEAIIIGGGLINSKEFWLEKLQKSFKEMCNSSLQPEILSAKYLNDAGMIGAAKLAFDYIT